MTERKRPGEPDDAPTLADEPVRKKTRMYGALDVPDDPATAGESTGGTSPELRPIGTMLGRYRIGETLGRGGMGEVVTARDEQIGRSVAIKRLRVADPGPEVLARFLREARIQGRLEHPAVVPVHELWYDEGGQPFFVMKQLSGVTLAELIPKLWAKEPEALERFGLNRLLRAFAEACLAIEFAHTRGVVHRDLKPANIMLGDFGEVYVLDWGIARVAGDPTSRRDSFGDIDTAPGTETVAGAILGTPGYISPEQIRHDADLDHRADVYALGCILFEILSLQPLHPRGQAGLASALAGADARPSVRAPERDIPPELGAICVRATAVDRNERFATARELGDAVQRFLDGNRDVALRKELARNERMAARDALAAGDRPHDRRNAMRAAARAIALDPTDRESLELVGRLMLEPPRDTPSEVVAELAQLDHQQLRASARFGLVASLAYLGFFPILYWVGFREPWYLIAGPALALVIVFAEIVVAPRNAYWSGYIAIAGNAAMFALFAYLVSPIVIGPGPAIIIVMLLAVHRTLIRPWLLAILTWVATLSPWFLEAAGVLGARTSIAGSDIVLHTAAEELHYWPAMLGLAFYIVALIHLGALLSRLQDDDRRRQRRALQLQSWQLRHLVPRANTGPSIPTPNTAARR
jgi:serine/threonine-protein kinase